MNGEKPGLPQSFQEELHACKKLLSMRICKTTSFNPSLTTRQKWDAKNVNKQNKYQFFMRQEEKKTFSTMGHAVGYCIFCVPNENGWKSV